MGRLKSLKPQISVLNLRKVSVPSDKPWGRSKGEGRILKGRKLQRARKHLFSVQPLCVICEREGRVTVATIRDHIVPLAEGGLDVFENTQALCRECSDKKTAEESKRGKLRAREGGG